MKVPEKYWEGTKKVLRKFLQITMKALAKCQKSTERECMLKTLGK